MRAVKKWRYYCDFCSRAMMVKKAAEKHERGCTMNPARECGLCRIAGLAQQPITDLMAPLQDYDFDALKKLADDCPACILAAIRQFNNPLGVGDRFSNDWDFKAELTEFWKSQNDQHDERFY